MMAKLYRMDYRAVGLIISPTKGSVTRAVSSFFSLDHLDLVRASTLMYHGGMLY